MYSRSIKSLSAVFVIALAALIPVNSSAQSTGKMASAGGVSKWDIFAGYSYLAPKGSVTTPTLSGGTLTGSYKAINVGGLFSGSYFFNKFVGVQAEYGFHEWGTENPNGGYIGTRGNNDGFQTVAGGLIGRFPADNITPFIHGLVGGADVTGPTSQGPKWGPQLTIGGGMDYELPFLNHRFAFRLFQADFQYTHANFGPGPTPPGGRANINAARLSTGFVIHAGTIIPPPPVTLACSASPASVFPGEPITVTATAGNLDPKMSSIYTWSGSGASGTGTTTTIQTASLDPGNYSVKGDVKEGKSGKEGLKPGQSADCSSSFTVKDFEPPTISCSVTPTTIKPGDSATVNCAGTSPQNRPLTYSYTTTAGTVTGSGTTAQYSSAGAPTGAVGITGKVADDKGHTSSADTSLTIVAPPPPPPPAPSPQQVQLEARLALHSVFFPTDLPKAANPNGGLVTSQEGTLTTLASDFKQYLQFKPDAKLTLIGHADSRGSSEYNQALSDRRVSRTKQFLVEQGIAESSIETRAVGKEENLSADQVKGMVDQNSDLTPAERQKFTRNLSTIVWAQNRRVDVVLSTTGQQSVRQFPFNAADSLTLLSTKTPAGHKNAATTKKTK
jgi:outer membrane protein OmpA-like peptidoglycan-associated protein